MKNFLQVSLVLAALCIGAGIEAYTVVVQNATPSTVRVVISYVGESAIACRKDDFELGAGHEKSISSGGCLLKNIQATVYRKERTQFTEGAQQELYQATAEYNSLGRGSGTFIVYGPVGGKYGITRDCSERGSSSN
jgi:hypothetical protein